MASSARLAEFRGMDRTSHSLATLVLAGALTAPASAAEPTCLNIDEMREAVRDGHAVPAATATRIARDASRGEVLRVRLCRHNEALVYRITTLARDGRVAHVTIDGASGKLAQTR